MEIAGHELERERILEILVAVPGVLAFIGVLVYLGSEFNDESLSQEGGLMLVAAIAGFVLVMSIVGIGLAYLKNPASEDESADADATTEEADGEPASTESDN